jgi:hypothetical protein
MTPERFKSLLAGMTAVAAKVLGAVPIAESWTSAEIIAELVRQGQTIRDRVVVEGCLGKLREAGLVREAEPQKFRRVKVRERATVKKEAPEVAPKEQEQMIPATIVPGSAETLSHALSPRKPGHLERLGAISADLRQRAQSLIQLADSIDAAALATEDEIAALGADSRKLRQLQALLTGAATV